MHFIYSYNEILLKAHNAMSIRHKKTSSRSTLQTGDRFWTKALANIKTYFSLKLSESLLD
jgi:hypothetical protein